MIAPWTIVYAARADGTVPGIEFLDSAPAQADARIIAVLEAVAAAPPPQFSGGGMWEAMHGSMGGYYEVRVLFQRRLYRLFCLLDRQGPGLPGPALVVIAGLVKPERTRFSDREYAGVRALGDEYLNSSPRRIG